MRKRLVNEFAWSLSRDAVAERCMREYWYAYFCAWGGWERDASDESKFAYRVKKLDNRWSLPGKVVHSAIERWELGVRSGAPILPHHLLAGAVEELKSVFRSSRAGEYMRSKTPGLLEHHLELPVADEEWKEMRVRVEEGIRYFLADHSHAIAPHLDKLVRFEKFSKLDLDGVAVFAVPDFVMRDVPNIPGFGAAVALLIIDWKLGRPREEHEDQLVLYSLFVNHRTGLDMLQMRAEDRYLSHGEVRSLVPGGKTAQERLVTLSARIRARHDQIKSLMDGPETAPREAFPLTEDEGNCVKCRFRRLCKPNFQASAAPTAPVDDGELGE